MALLKQHKTGVAAEKMLISIIKRARHLIQKGENLFVSDSLRIFFEREIGIEHFAKEINILEAFLELDDYDLWGAIKLWSKHEDKTLSTLCTMLLQRKLFKIEVDIEPFSKDHKEKTERSIASTFGVSLKEAKYFYSSGKLTNNAYHSTDKNIFILGKDGNVRDVVEAADLPNIKAFSKIVRKYYCCWPKEISV